MTHDTSASVEEESDDEPPLEDDDILAWNFYMNNVSSFACDSGALSFVIANVTPYRGVALSLFMQKLSFIHRALVDKAEREAQRKPPADAIVGEDNV